MERAKINKIVTDLFTLKIVKNPPKIVVINPDDIPSEFKTQEVIEKVNRVYIREQLKQMEIKGVELVQETRLEIK